MSDPLRPLACTYCGGKLTVDTETTGRAYLTYEVPESITCDEMGCQAVWEPDGTPRELPAFVRFPSLYARPELDRKTDPTMPICPDCRTDDEGESYVCDPALTLCPLNRMTAAPTGPEPRTDAAPEMRVHREGEWWVIEVPGIGVTQARLEEDIERMARDLVSSLTRTDDRDPRTDAAVGR